MRTPIRSRKAPDRPVQTARLCAGLCCLAAMTLCGCSLSLPSMSSSTGVDYEATGSIKPSKPLAAPVVAPPASPLSARLDPEDWRRARAALGVALDPQGNGATVAWSNPQSGRAGSFVPVAAPYPVDGQVCRAFIAKIDADHVQGAACRIGGTDDWDVKNVRPFKDG